LSRGASVSSGSFSPDQHVAGCRARTIRPSAADSDCRGECNGKRRLANARGAGHDVQLSGREIPRPYPTDRPHLDCIATLQFNAR